MSKEDRIRELEERIEELEDQLEGQAKALKIAGDALASTANCVEGLGNRVKELESKEESTLGLYKALYKIVELEGSKTNLVKESLDGLSTLVMHIAKAIGGSKT